jgi:hypothetical protein
MTTPTGWLAERADRAFVAVSNLRASLWWPGSMWGFEHVARWIRNVTLHAPNHPALRGAVDELVSLVEAGKVFADYERNRLAAYNEEEVLAGLLAHYRHFKDERVLAAAKRIAQSIATNHPKLAGNHYYKGLAIGPLLDAGELPGARAIAEDQQLAVLRQKEAHGAAAAMILTGYARLFEQTHERRYLDWALAIHEAIRVRQFVTGGLGECLHFTAPPSESDLHDETCQHAWWMIANLALWRATTERRYLEQVERTFYNHFLFAQLHRGEDGGFCALGDVDQAFRGQHNYICCDNEGFYGLLEVIRHAVTELPDGVAVNLFLPVEAEINGLRLRIETEYPVTGRATIRILESESRPVTLRVHCPADSILSFRACEESPLPQRSNDRDSSQARNDKFVEWKRVWKTGDVVRVVIPMRMSVVADNTGLGARSVPVTVDGVELPAKRVAVLHGPVVAALFRTGHGCQLSWVWNGDYPEPLESNGGNAEEISVSTTGGLARVRWRDGTTRHEVTVLPGLPVTLDWKTTGGPVALRYATAKRAQNPRYGLIAFPYPFPAVTTRDDLRGNNRFVAGGGSFSLAETLTEGGELAKTGTVRLSNGTFRAICHYNPAAVASVTGRVTQNWAGVEWKPVGGELKRRLIFPLSDRPLSQDVTLAEWRARVRAEIVEGGLVLRGPVIEHLPVLLPRATGLQAGQVVGGAVVAVYDKEWLVARLIAPGRYRINL